VALRSFLQGLAEDAQKVPAADFSNLIRGEAGFYQRIDNYAGKSGRLILPYLIGAFGSTQTP
jgi:hypothetical protein